MKAPDIKVSDETLQLLETLKAQYGVSSNTEVLRIALRNARVSTPITQGARKGLSGIGKCLSSDQMQTVPVEASKDCGKRLFYFSRCKSPSPFEAKYLVSGLIEAKDETAAKGQLDAALEKTRASSCEFAFTVVDEIPRSPSGIVAITMGGDV